MGCLHYLVQEATVFGREDRYHLAHLRCLVCLQMGSLILPSCRFSPDAFNNAQSYNGGSVSLAHELGHYFGLLHTHEGGCRSPGDAVSDTIPSKDPGEHFDVDWYFELSDWCKDFRAGKQPKPAPLQKMKTCGASAPDNLFNLMSYMDDPCRMGFTENQVARMQWAVSTYRPKMMNAHAVSKSATSLQ